MAYFSRPYLPFTLAVPDPTRSFEIDHERLQVKVMGSVALEVALPAAAVGRPAGVLEALMQVVLNRGTVEVTDSGGTRHLLRRVRDVHALRAALMGTHPTIVSIRRLANLKDDDLADCVIYYPHIPCAVYRLLQSREPTKYQQGGYRILVREGAGVPRGEVIATYGDVKITSPLAGRVEFLGKPTPGIHEWPDPQEWQSTSDTEEGSLERALKNVNYNAIMFPDHVDNQEAYAFALRPLRDPHTVGTRGEYRVFDVRSAFDYGHVWIDMKRKRGDTMYSVIDKAIFDLKSPGSGIQLPEALQADPEYSSQLMRYWDLINRGQAMVQYIGKPA